MDSSAVQRVQQSPWLHNDSQFHLSRLNTVVSLSWHSYPDVLRILLLAVLKIHLQHEQIHPVVELG